MFKDRADVRYRGRRVKGVVGLACAATVALTLSACGDSGGGSTPSASKCSPNVKIVENTPQAFRLPIFVALNKGYWKDAGLNVSMVEVQNGSQTDQLVAGGKAEFGSNQLVSALNLGANNVKVSIVGMMSSRIANSIVARKGLGDGKLTPALLRSSKIGITVTGSGTWQYVLYVAKALGVPQKDLHFVEVGTTGANALRSGRVDLYSYADPQNMSLVNSGDANWFADTVDATHGVAPGIPALERQATEPYLNNMVYTTNDYLKRCGANVDKLVAGLDKAAKWIHANANNPEAIADVAKQYKPFEAQDTATLAAALDRLLKAGAFPEETVRVDRAAYQNAMDYATSLGKQYKPIPFETLVPTKFRGQG